MVDSEVPGTAVAWIFVSGRPRARARVECSWHFGLTGLEHKQNTPNPEQVAKDSDERNHEYGVHEPLDGELAMSGRTSH